MSWLILLWFFFWLVFLVDWVNMVRAKRYARYLQDLQKAAHDMSPESLRNTLKEMNSSITSWRGAYQETLLQFILTETNAAEQKGAFWLKYFMVFHETHMNALLASEEGARRKNALHTAISHGHFNIIKEMIRRYPRLLLQRDENDCLPVMLALEMQNLGMMQILLSVLRNAQLYSYSWLYTTLFVESVCAYGSPEIVAWLLSSGEVCIRPEHASLLAFHVGAVIKEASNLYVSKDIPPRRKILDQYLPLVLTNIVLEYARPNSYKECLIYFVWEEGF